jgi:peptide deformylase
MAILKVARLGHPVLRRVADPIPSQEIAGPEIQALIQDMFETMDEYNGVGLAAPQVHVSKQLALVGGETDDDGTPLVRVVINPEITPTTDKLFGMYEGCLSLPGMRGYVERPAAVHVRYLDEDGEVVEEDLEGYQAVVMQHEYDHLQGRVYIERMKDLRRLAFEEEADRYLPVDVMNDGRDV